MAKIKWTKSEDENSMFWTFVHMFSSILFKKIQKNYGIPYRSPRGAFEVVQKVRNLAQKAIPLGEIHGETPLMP